MNPIRSVQKYGRVRFHRSLLDVDGSFVTSSLRDDGILLTAAKATDRDGPTSVIHKLYFGDEPYLSVTIPAKLRRAAGIGEAVLIEKREDGLLLRPDPSEAAP